jgi:hypothetical protein
MVPRPVRQGRPQRHSVEGMGRCGEHCACLTMNGVGEPCAGEPHARFDRGPLAKKTAAERTPRWARKRKPRARRQHRQPNQRPTSLPDRELKRRDLACSSCRSAPVNLRIPESVLALGESLELLSVRRWRHPVMTHPRVVLPHGWREVLVYEIPNGDADQPVARTVFDVQ